MKQWIGRVLSARQSERGVTLIELLAVIVILAIIAAVAVPVILNSINKAKVNATEQSEAVIAEALNRYAANNNGQFPKSDTKNDITPLTDELTQAKDSSGSNTGGPYLQSVPSDGWGQPFTYQSDGTSFTLTSSQDKIVMTNTQSAPSVG